MIKEFLGDDFFLETQTAQKLYHECAAQLPVIDFHNHLPPAEISANRVFANLTEAWLEGDHYKWRAMRANGIPEKFITSPESTPHEKFLKWAETVPSTVRNPLFHWTHLELRRYFGIKELLVPGTGDQIYFLASEMLQSPDFGARSLLEKMNVEQLCTTDDPLSDLSHHRKFAKVPGSVKMLPTFRPDPLFAVDQDFYLRYLGDFGEVAGYEINSFDKLLEAARDRIDFFHTNGCRLSDHGLEQFFAVSPSFRRSASVFAAVFSGETISRDDVMIFQTTFLLELSKIYHERGWVQQFHLGSIRNVNEKIIRDVGKDSGVDSIGDFAQIKGLAMFLNELERTDQLTKTIVYNLNPADSEAIATMLGNFNDGSIAGKMQYGAAWWFLDQKDGIEKQLNVLSNMGLLNRFVGMLTDSRSFLSFPRHEYFRRILCNLIGGEVERGELPNDLNFLGEIIKKVCYLNAREYFGFNKVDVAAGSEAQGHLVNE